MQQTTKYQLNLIEKDDVFSPDALNENTQEVEKQLSRLDGADAALDARVTLLEARKLLLGTYAGDGSRQTVPLESTPMLVFIHRDGTGGASAFCFRDGPFVSSYSPEAEIVEGGFLVASSLLNGKNYTYHYLAVI